LQASSTRRKTRGVVDSAVSACTMRAQRRTWMRQDFAGGERCAETIPATTPPGLCWHCCPSPAAATPRIRKPRRAGAEDDTPWKGEGWMHGKDSGKRDMETVTAMEMETMETDMDMDMERKRKIRMKKGINLEIGVVTWSA